MNLQSEIDAFVLSMRKQHFNGCKPVQDDRPDWLMTVAFNRAFQLHVIQIADELSDQRGHIHPASQIYGLVVRQFKLTERITSGNSTALSRIQIEAERQALMLYCWQFAPLLVQQAKGE